MRRGHRKEMQWGNDFSCTNDETMAKPIELAPPPTPFSSSHWGVGESSSASTFVVPALPQLKSVDTNMGPPKLGSGPALSIDTRPRPLDACLVFKKRPSPPMTSPGIIKSSLAQKKKRPAPLMLPDAAPSDGGGPSPPSTLVTGPTLSTVDLNELALEDVLHEGHSVYGIQSSKGRRRYMEDTYTVHENLDGLGNEAYFGVFDGHGGRRAADFAAQNLYEYISSDKLFSSNVAEAVGSAFRKADKEFVELAEQQELRDGTTAVAAYIRKGHMWIANVGDSRAVLCRGGEAHAMSEDHRPDRESEQLRIESNGGTVLHMGSWRVEGVLAVTRAIGDKDLKKCVKADPHIMEVDLQEDDELLVMASDGLWDYMSNQEVVDEAKLHTDPSVAAKALVDEAMKRGSRDNVTVLVVHTSQYVEQSCSPTAEACWEQSYSPTEGEFMEESFGPAHEEYVDQSCCTDSETILE